MVEISVRDRAGNLHPISAPADRSLMEAIREAGLDELLALCGGACSCATCHVYVDVHESSPLLTRTADEDDLLDATSHRKANSRLSCQLRLSPELSGMAVTIAPEE